MYNMYSIHTACTACTYSLYYCTVHIHHFIIMTLLCISLLKSFNNHYVLQLHTYPTCHAKPNNSTSIHSLCLQVMTCHSRIQAQHIYQAIKHLSRDHTSEFWLPYSYNVIAITSFISTCKHYTSIIPYCNSSSVAHVHILIFCIHLMRYITRPKLMMELSVWQPLYSWEPRELGGSTMITRTPAKSSAAVWQRS